MLKLYGFWRSLASCRVRIALNLKGIPFEETSINLMKGEQHADSYKAINPEAVVPSLIIDDDPPLFQSLAIIEYIDETHPAPPLLPRDPRARARVRGIAQIIAADTHPLIVPRVRDFLEKDFGLDEPKRMQWIKNWSTKGLQAVEAQLARDTQTARFCHGTAPTLADICVVSQVFGAQLFGFDTSGVPTVMRVFEECMKIDAFERAQPLKQPGAPAPSGAAR
jgi:maleylacetoacetate isomerase